MAGDCSRAVTAPGPSPSRSPPLRLPPPASFFLRSSRSSALRTHSKSCTILPVRTLTSIIRPPFPPTTILFTYVWGWTATVGTKEAPPPPFTFRGMVFLTARDSRVAWIRTSRPLHLPAPSSSASESESESSPSPPEEEEVDSSDDSESESESSPTTLTPNISSSLLPPPSILAQISATSRAFSSFPSFSPPIATLTRPRSRASTTLHPRRTSRREKTPAVDRALMRRYSVTWVARPLLFIPWTATDTDRDMSPTTRCSSSSSTSSSTSKPEPLVVPPDDDDDDEGSASPTSTVLIPSSHLRTWKRFPMGTVANASRDEDPCVAR
mmetsp:Transcript_41509/g.125772  ORF Transcript_41509/g.125772 Transcript_41509/m.125772 type:complete len:325 (+) Transcript_41509:2174-3148(+)